MGGLYNFIGYVVAYAPDCFPKEDNLFGGDQMSVERAFEELRRGVALIEGDIPGAGETRGLNLLLDEAVASYREGEVRNAVRTSHRFEAAIFKRDSYQSSECQRIDGWIFRPRGRRRHDAIAVRKALGRSARLPSPALIEVPDMAGRGLRLSLR